MHEVGYWSSVANHMIKTRTVCWYNQTVILCLKPSLCLRVCRTGIHNMTASN
jgi:hypothetical protein